MRITIRDIHQKLLQLERFIKFYIDLLADFNYIILPIFRLFRVITIFLVQFNDARKYFSKKYLYTINHKRIALNYFFFSVWTSLSGASLATMIRLEMAYPGSPFFKGDSLRYLQVISAHGLIMVFFVVVPIIFGGFANFFLPYHIGSKDVAFPRLNSIGFWIQPLGFLLIAKAAFLRNQYWHYYDRVSFFLPIFNKIRHQSIFPHFYRHFTTEEDADHLWAQSFQSLVVSRKLLSSFKGYPSYYVSSIQLAFWSENRRFLTNFWSLVDKSFKFRRRKVFFSKCSNRTLTTSGWTFITPLSSNIEFTGLGAQDMLLVSVVLAGLSTTISFTNLLVTRRILVAAGMRNRRVLMPFITIATLLTLRMLAIVTPVLGAAVLMSLMDRHWQTSFFDFAYGGDPILFQHLFWFFGHPEVYILIIPTFGFVNMIIPFFTLRRMASKHHMIWAVYVMAYMGYFVWGHHMYLVGLDHRSRNMYSTITIMISLPATIKLVNWTLSLANGVIKIDLALMFIISYIFFFLTGGFTGMWLSHVGLNISMHDSFYVVAHFHLMLAGATIIGCFAGLYYYFYTLFGFNFADMFGRLHLFYYTAGIWFTFLPMFFLGFSGLPRRVHDFPAVFLGWQGAATCGHFLTMTGVLFFLFVFIDSLFKNSLSTRGNIGIPRWIKRFSYYYYKMAINLENNTLYSNIPNANTRLFINKNKFYEFECFRYSDYAVL